MKKVRDYLASYFTSIKKLPTLMVAVLCVTIVVMNILATKTIFQNDLIAIDGGIVITWICIIIMDVIVINYGPRSAIRLSIFALVINIIVSVIFFLVSLIPTTKDYSAFNQTLSSTWFILVSSTVAFICSTSLDAFLNYSIGKLFKNHPESKTAYRCRCFVSTAVSAIVDNFIFNCLAFVVFAPIFWDGFHWTLLQCIMCALVYGAIELAIEIVVSPIVIKLIKKTKEKQA